MTAAEDRSITTYSQETLDAMQEIAETLSDWASNVRYNNHNLNPEWDGRAKGLDVSANHIFQQIKAHTKGEPV
jgi:hypothetical protein